MDDEIAYANVLRDEFVRKNFLVITALNGAEGLERALVDHPDLILLDIIMPIMDGMTMLHRLRNDSWGRTAKVIALTNLVENDPAVVPMGSDEFDYYLMKINCTPDGIVRVVEEVLEVV